MSKPEQKSHLNVVMGCMTFGRAGIDEARVHTVEDVGKILDVFQAHGHYELDTARSYTKGTSEEMLGELGWQKRGLIVATKLYPNILNSQYSQPGAPKISHGPEDLRKWLDISLKALQTDSIDLWYLHAPDRSTPYEVTLQAIDALHKEGKFRRWGLSNYYAWEVAEIVHICRTKGYVAPSVYQGIYNAVHRQVEPELFPCLRKYGLSFYAYNPLGGGFFTGRYRSMEDKPEAGSRFDPQKNQGRNYRNRYWNEPYFKALGNIEEVAKKHGLSLGEVALRWLSHHSQLRREHGDAVIIGASSLNHIEQNLADLEKGPLPEDVVRVLDESWVNVKGLASNYFR